MTEPIGGEDALLRRVPDAPHLWTSKGGTIRPTSLAMKPHDDDQGLSVDVRRLLPDPADPLSVLVGYEDYALAEFRARVAFDLGLGVEHDPIPDNPAHANVVGFAEMGKTAAKRAQRELAKKAAWVRMPPSAPTLDGEAPA